MGRPSLSPELQEKLLDAFLKPVSWLNTQLIRATGGRVGGAVGGVRICVLTTTGRRSGEPRSVALVYFRDPEPDGADIVLVASKGGMPHHPHWYLNLRDDPNVEIEIGRERRGYTARTATPDEKLRLWPRAVATYKGYAGYQRRTDRDIPVVVCTPR